MQLGLSPPQRVPSYSESVATSAPTPSECSTRHSASGIYQSDQVPSKPQPNTSSSSV